MEYLYELASFVIAFLIAHALWQFLFFPLALLYPVAAVITTALVVAVLLIVLLLRRAEEAP